MPTDLSARANDPATAKANVLLVDDNAANLLVLEAVLESLGHNLVQAHSGEEALRLLLEQDFAVVLLDVQMPGLDGFDTARLLRGREQGRHTPIIFLTAFEDPRFPVEQAYALGAVDYLVKPFVPLILRAKVAGFVDLFQKTEQIKRQAEQLRLLERQRHEQKLAEESARFRALTQHSSDAVTLLGPDATVRYSSPSGLHVLGYEPEEALGRNAFDLVHPDDQERARGMLAQLVGQPRTPVAVEMRLRHQDGSWRWMQSVGTNLLDDPAVGALIVNLQDITERHCADEALRESEQRFARFMHHFAGLAWIKDAEGRYVYANDSALKAFRLHAEELYGKTDEEVFPPTTAAQFKENDRLALTGAAGARVVETLEHADGVLHHSLVSKFPIPSLDGKAALVGGMAIDITEHVQTRAILEESEQRFRQLAENVTAVFWMSDLDKAQVLYVSPAYETVWGRSCRSLYEQPRSFLDAIHEEDRGRVIATSLQRQSQGEPADVEYRVVRPDGSVRWVRDRSFPVRDQAGQAYRMAGIAEDITDRKNAEAKLRQGEERFRLLTEVMPQLVWSSLPDGSIDYCNPRWLDFTGLCQEQVQGDGWTLALHPDDRAAALSAWKRATETGEEYQVEQRLRGKDGDCRWFLTRALPLRDAGGQVVKWFGTCTDIEERKRMEGALQQADRRKDEFLAMLAHELRNPLAPIRTAVGIMRMLGSTDPNFQRAREVIDRQVGQLTRLVDDLLDVSRITRGKVTLRKEPVDLAVVLNRAVETSRPLIEANRHTLFLSPLAEPVCVLADATRLEQVFANLLNNAAKYTERGGSIWLEAQRQGDEVLVRVRDSGFGIPAQVLPHIFDLFTQAERTLDRAQGGLGIGLTLVKRLVDMHGGGVTAHSDGPGKGSELLVRLPISAATGAQEAEKRVPPLAIVPERPALRVLVVDDSRDAAESLALLLRLWGYEVRTAHDGLSGVKAACSYRPAVVLLDIGLPGLNGYEVARRLREELGQGTRLVAVTGYGQEVDRLKALEAGFDAHLVKPADPAALQALLAEVQPIL